MKSSLTMLFLCAAGWLFQASAEPLKLFPETKAKAEKGDAAAQHNLGRMYAYGSEVAKDEVEAAKWYRKAAEQGYANAQFNLGFMYVKGQGVAKDEVMAYKWFLLAGAKKVIPPAGRQSMWAQGDEAARKYIPIIEANLTPSQRAEGQRLAREWKPQGSNP